MIKTEDEIENAKTGQRLLFIRPIDFGPKETLHIRATYPAFSVEPPVHFHPKQTEYFSVLEGQLNVRINNQIHIVKTGGVVTVLPNQHHSMWNSSDKEAVVDWRVEPAMQTESFLRMMTKVANGPGVNQLGMPNPLKSLYILSMFSDTIRLPGVPDAAAQILNVLLSPVFHFIKRR